MPVEKTSSQPETKQNSSKRARLKLSTKASGQKSSGSNKKRRIAIASVVALVVIVGGFVWWTFGGGSTLGVQNSMTSYLKDKYDKDFVVGRPRLQGTGLAITGSYRAEAYPKDDKSLVFMVGKVQKEERFFDDYTAIIWEREERPRVEAFLEKLYPSQAPKFDLSTSISTKRQEPDPIRGSVPNIDYAIKSYGDNFFYSLTVRVYVKTLNDKEKESIRIKFATLADFIKNKEVGLPSLTLLISATDKNVGYLCRAEFDSFLVIDKTLNNCLNVSSKKGIY